MQPDTKPAAAAVTGQKKSKDRHRPGYVAPTRVDTKMLTAAVPAEVKQAFLDKVAKEGKTVQEVITEFALSYAGDEIAEAKRKAIISEEIRRKASKYGLAVSIN